MRRLDGQDTEAVMELHNQLTDRERYQRFFVADPPFLDEFARKVVLCDQQHWALGAFDGERLIGIANYVVSSKPDVAEVAIAVAHHDHLRGVATALLRELAMIAVGNGIHRFTADVLAVNGPMLKVLSDADWRHTTRFRGPVLSIGIDLSQFADELASAHD